MNNKVFRPWEEEQLQRERDAAELTAWRRDFPAYKYDAETGAFAHNSGVDIVTKAP